MKTFKFVFAVAVLFVAHASFAAEAAGTGDAKVNCADKVAGNSTVTPTAYLPPAQNVATKQTGTTDTKSAD